RVPDRAAFVARVLLLSRPLGYRRQIPADRFGTDRRLQQVRRGSPVRVFPSAALAWRASEEGFVKRLGWFDDLKLRASYGRTGNQDIPNYGPLARVDPTVYVFGGNRGVGFVPTTLANPDLRWETTDGIDLGVDATFLKSRIAVTADYYHKKTHDLLYYVPVPGTSGFSTSLQNIGSLRNRG